MLGATLTVAAALQFVLLALPAVILGLGLYGSNFHEPSGKVIAGAVGSLPLVVALTRLALRSRAVRTWAWWPAAALCAATQLRAHLHLRAFLWQEGSEPLAWLLAQGLLASAVLATLAVDRLRRDPRAWGAGLPGALALTALYWFAAELMPHAPLLGSATLAFAALGVGPARGARPLDALGELDRPGGAGAHDAPDGGPGSGARTPGLPGWFALAAMGLSFPVWGRALSGGWGASVGVGLVAAALGAAWNLRRDGPLPRPLLAGFALAFLVACEAGTWGWGFPSLWLSGLVLGAGLAEGARCGRRLPLMGLAALLAVAWLAAHLLTQNLALSGVRGAFLLPMLVWLAWSGRRAGTASDDVPGSDPGGRAPAPAPSDPTA